MWGSERFLLELRELRVWGPQPGGPGGRGAAQAGQLCRLSQVLRQAGRPALHPSHWRLDPPRLLSGPRRHPGCRYLALQVSPPLVLHTVVVVFFCFCLGSSLSSLCEACNQRFNISKYCIVITSCQALGCLSGGFYFFWKLTQLHYSGRDKESSLFRPFSAVQIKKYKVGFCLKH